MPDKDFVRWDALDILIELANMLLTGEAYVDEEWCISCKAHRRFIDDRWIYEPHHYDCTFHRAAELIHNVSEAEGNS